MSFVFDKTATGSGNPSFATLNFYSFKDTQQVIVNTEITKRANLLDDKTVHQIKLTLANDLDKYGMQTMLNGGLGYKWDIKVGIHTTSDGYKELMK